MGCEVPATLEQALDPAWLTKALVPVTGGAKVTAVETVEVLRTMATKVRFTAAFDGAKGGKEAFCLKGALDVDADTARLGETEVKETDFYVLLAPKLSTRTPTLVAPIIDREAKNAVFIMRDLVAEGARFCTALEAFTPDQTAASLEQLARLHVSHTGAKLDALTWVPRQLASLAQGLYFPEAMLQGLMDDERGEGLPPRSRDAGLLLKAMKLLSAEDAERPHSLIHGDCHAGNIYETAEGPGLIDWQLIQRGGWSLDVAYHICATLPVELAEKEERRLLNHYLDFVRGQGAEVPDGEEAWLQYRKSAVYGYFLWAITRRVVRPIINVFNNRLGSSVTRHESYKLLGL